MRKPVSEHSSTIKAKKGSGTRKSEPRTSRLEAVPGGSVRRIEFEDDEPTPRRAAEPSYHPRTHDSMDQIHFEVDNLDRLRRGLRPRTRKQRSSETLYETDRGAVRRSRVETEKGDREMFHTSRRKGRIEEERRFNPAMVDRIISRVDDDQGPRFEEAGAEEPKKGLLKRTKTVKKTTKRKVTKPVPRPEEPEYQPQCAAITRDGMQCRNSAKAGSDMCGSHQSYAPRSAAEVLDTLPTRGEDTLAGEGDQAGTGQCAAYTKEGLQCRRSSRKSSKYCSVHKGYRQPSKAALEKRMDTKPRHAKAEDTLPRTK